MELLYFRCDLFSMGSTIYLAHCISADYALGKGIAVEFQRRYDLRWRLEERGRGKWPDCILIGRVFNLVTKPRYFDKPTYVSLESSLLTMKGIIERAGIKEIAMPKIGCGLDRLAWPRVEALLKKTFADTDAKITVCYL